MAKAKNPVTLSKSFNIDQEKLNKLGVLDATLAIDTRLFIDPLLLSRSKHQEISKRAVEDYHNHFELVIKLLSKSKCQGDVAWKSAEKKLKFHEINGTCLGYGAGSIHGSGFGPQLTTKVLKIARQIVDIGVDDPDLFMAMALFEPDIGPDRISDMTTNIIIGALADFNVRIIGELGLKGTKFPNGIFLKNPFEKKPTPIIMLPTDILRNLPVAHDWDSVMDAAQQNEELREQINQHVASIWAEKTKRDKKQLKSQALNNREAFETLLKAIKCVPGKPYDVEEDPDGLIIWATKGESYAQQHPISFALKTIKSIDDVFNVVKEIVGQFRHLVERQGLNKELYERGGKARHESTAQRLFFAVAYAYCKANNVDVSPEIDTGNGKVDFKFSSGFDKRVLVEIKLSTNNKVVTGYKNQLEVYKDAEETMKAVYLVIDVGKMGKKDAELLKMKNEASARGEPLSDLEFVDGIVKPSASKR